MTARIMRYRRSILEENTIHVKSTGNRFYFTGNQLAAHSGAEGRAEAESSAENGVAFRQAAGHGASAGIGSGV